jgi:hypothetical protein
MHILMDVDGNQLNDVKHVYAIDMTIVMVLVALLEVLN